MRREEGKLVSYCHLGNIGKLIHPIPARLYRAWYLSYFTCDPFIARDTPRAVFSISSSLVLLLFFFFLWRAVKI